MNKRAAFRNAMEVVQHLGDETPPWEAFLQSSRTLLGADAAAFLMFDGAQNLDELRHSDIDSSAAREYLEHFSKDDAIAQSSRTSPAGKWWDSVELASAPDAQRLPFYADFMPRHRLGQVIALILLAQPGRQMAVSFHRTSARANAIEEFSQGNVRVFTECLLRAVGARVAHAEMRIGAVEAALASINEAAFLTNRTGELVHCSMVAYKLLGEAQMLTRSQRALSHPCPQIIQGLLQAITLVLSSNRPRQYCVPLSWGEGVRFDITIAPQNLRMANESLLLVRARKTSAFDVPGVAELGTFFGLSVAESRVLLLLIEGRSPKEVAIANNVAERTVRNQVVALMRKMSCTRLSELVRLGSLLR
ncbi:helix-turn-helix transcriptional regulator [Paraburkholderia panacisoli]|uniref:Helix-turn-helix transcriptional regulator n=1 Tax=Paraburkholderia panacisoli TaxID=2603818 RepID=A0A5B0GTI0_9BURK|nr:helix-turn-helix transcriptional regulator [Paraburkholderia panacisoli]KAA1006197.1 helix-turn-helix transcriptional regulator [Paraburkholderia panacisoli]